jgi:hypothetical protein
MMGKSYQRETRRSRRKAQNLQHQSVTVDVAGGKASFQMVLLEAAGAIEQTASQAGLLNLIPSIQPQNSMARSRS